MMRRDASSHSISILVALVAMSGVLAGVAPANAVVYCKAAGVPRGCVARPVGATAVVHPVVHPAATRPVVYCKRVGVPKGCVMR